MSLLAGKKLLITGVLTPDSLAFHVAKAAMQEGAEVALTGFGRGLSLTRRAARRLPTEPRVYDMDATSPTQISSTAEALKHDWGRLDGLLHAIGFAPESCLGEDFMKPGWEDVALTIHVSAYSLKSLAEGFLSLLSLGTHPSIVALDFDATKAWPSYNWMGVAKACLEAEARYLARALGPAGVRVNLVAAGPIRTMAAKSIPGFSSFESVFSERAPLGWDVRADAAAVAKACVALFSDYFPKTTGEIVHVDGGFHAVGA
jgi:enoyl ACP reductase